MSNALCKTAAACLLALTGGCGPEGVEYVDPEVDYGDDTTTVPTGDPELLVGLYREQLYRPLEDGDRLPIVWGLQGGNWVMPTVRVRGIGTPGRLGGTLVTASGEVLGNLDSSVNFIRGAGGWLEVQAVPIPVQRERPEDPLDALYGQRATLDLQAVDTAERSATVNVTIELTGG